MIEERRLLFGVGRNGFGKKREREEEDRDFWRQRMERVSEILSSRELGKRSAVVMFPTLEYRET